MNRLRCVVGVITASALCSVASAGRAYSVDNNTRSLVRVDTLTGNATVIGPLTGFTGSIFDMHFLGSRLFAVANVAPNLKRLLELNPLTGAIISDTAITNGGPSFTDTLEGLAQDDQGRLVVSFWLPGAISTTTSYVVGVLGLNGVIGDISVYDIDIDGLGSRAAGGFFAIDRQPNPINQNVIFALTQGPSVATPLRAFPFDTTVNGLDDIAETRDGLLAFDFANRFLHLFSSTTGELITSVPYPKEYTFLHIAVPPRCPGDANDDGLVSFPDITAVLTNWNSMYTPPGGPGDANADGTVSFPDITEILTNWDTQCL